MSPFIVLGLLILLPLLGVWFSGRPLSPYLTFPPIPTDPGMASFSWGIFLVLAFILLCFLSPFPWRIISYSSSSTKKRLCNRQKFPWWGWLALFWIFGAWVLAWTRFDWFASWQPHTFPLLWFGYIFLINAFTYSRSGSCLFFDHPGFFLKLFPVSAAFWWYFEYLNQFVENWHYVNLPDLSPLEYTFHTSLAFSTVLPAFFCTMEFFASFSRVTLPFRHWRPVHFLVLPHTGWMFVGIGSLGLLAISHWPTVLFPFLWIAPLLILVGIKVLWKESTFLSSLRTGNWLPVILPSLAALACGFWWECWNLKSLTHWEYTIPFVYGFKVFEMPILGYAGYLPFGLECVAAAEFALGAGLWDPRLKIFPALGINDDPLSDIPKTCLKEHSNCSAFSDGASQ